MMWKTSGYSTEVPDIEDIPDDVVEQCLVHAGKYECGNCGNIQWCYNQPYVNVREKCDNCNEQGIV